METQAADRRPLIGITTCPTFKHGRTFSTVCHAYASSIAMAGGRPILIPVFEDYTEAAAYADLLDGLVITGGDEDLDPHLYGENPIPALQAILPQRDLWEFALLRAFLEANKPVLGICRGAQVINAARGGTIYQDLDTQFDNVLGHFPKKTAMHQLWHDVEFEPGSRMHRIFGTDKLRVNSFHHQAVKDPAPGFKVTARAPDGVIEAIESEDHGFVVGVQWHPEALAEKHPEFLKLFEATVRACQR